MDEKVSRLALELSAFWSSLLSSQPKYGLDFSWPSVGSLNLILSHLFDQKNFSQTDEKLVQGAAAYLAVSAASYWETLGEKVTVEMSCEEAPSFEIHLHVSGEPFGAPREKYSLPVFSALKTILQDHEAALRVFESFQAGSQWLGSRVTLFSLSLFTGLCSFAEGKWAHVKYRDAKRYFTPLAQRLGETAANYYEIVFPTEEFGRDAKNYLGRLIPPAGSDEDFFGGRAAFTLAQTLQQSGLDETAKREVAINAAMFPDLQVAAPGYAVAVALSLADPSERLLAISNGFGVSKLSLKQAITLCRRAFELPAVFQSAAETDLTPETEILLQGEMQLGLLPHWRVDLRELLPVPTLIQLLYWSMTSQARVAIDAHFRQNKRTPALILQGIYLDFVNGDFDRAEKELQDATNNSSIIKLADNALLSLKCELMGSLASIRSDIDLAFSMFNRACAVPGLSVFRKSALLGVLGECHAARNDTNEALRCFREASEIFPNVSAELSALRLSQKLQPDENYTEAIESILRIAPRNEVAFRMFAVEKLRALK